VFGLMVIVCGTGGTVLGGIVNDALARRGVRAPGLVVPVASALAAAPFVAGFALAPSTQAALVLLTPAMTFGAMPFGAGTAAIVSLAPNRMRGQMVAIYMLVATLVGTGGGPWVIAAWTDDVLGDPAQIRWSIAVVATALFVIGAAIIATGLRRPRHG
jgi:MFS family permease